MAVSRSNNSHPSAPGAPAGDPILSPCAREVFNAIVRQIGMRACCSISYADLAREVGYAPRSVVRAVRLLSARGLLMVEPQRAPDGACAPHRYSVAR